jgi:serine/threonine protein phosphatase PrpC
LTDHQIATDPRARHITGWLASDAPNAAPHILSFGPSDEGRLVVCSDGLSRYLPSAASLGSWVATADPGAPPIAVARTLVQLAIAAGGRDNVTVVVVDVGRRRQEGS